MTMTSRMVALVTALVLVGAGLAWAQTSTAPASPQQPASKMEGHTMSGSMMGEPAEGGSMMDDCKAMMAKRQAMMDEMEAMDARLDALVEEMNTATGSAKVDATAAAVTELAAQRTAMRSMMESMQPMMMQHMSKHMRSETTEGMSGSMSACPMMGGAKPAEGGHEAHH